MQKVNNNCGSSNVPSHFEAKKKFAFCYNFQQLNSDLVLLFFPSDSYDFMTLSKFCAMKFQKKYTWACKTLLKLNFDSPFNQQIVRSVLRWKYRAKTAKSNTMKTKNLNLACYTETDSDLLAIIIVFIHQMQQHSVQFSFNSVALTTTVKLKLDCCLLAFALKQ